jgi:predicted transcriptional regulator
LVQIGLGLIASYQQGGGNATVNRRPNGMASIVMVSPPDDVTKAAWAQTSGGVSQFTVNEANAMRGVIRVGDSTSHGGEVMTGQEKSRVMDRAVARVGDRCTCPMCGHHD